MKLMLGIAAGLVLIVGLFVYWFTPVAAINYSDGQRTGLLVKISKKGLFCKTWEGYILVGNGNNVQPETFNFTVKNDELAHLLELQAGNTVTLDYHQFAMTSPCWGETDYRVDHLTIK